MKMPEGTKDKKKGTGIVRTHLQDIEKFVQEGYSLNQIFDVLVKDEGLQLTFQAFKNALARVRKNAKNGLANRQPTQPVRLATGDKGLRRTDRELPENSSEARKPATGTNPSLTDILSGRFNEQDD